MMANINTVLGVVDSEELGVTYMHEHVLVVSPEFQHYWPGYAGWDREVLVERARTTLKALHDDYGVDTILDPTVAGLGRNIRAVADAAEGTGINVIVATGWYTYSELPLTFWSKDHEGRIDELVRLFMMDIEQGLEGTSIKPGVIKCSTDQPGLTPDVEAILRAAARTHLQSGLPITTHTSYINESGLLQQQIFKEEGVDMEAVVIGHCNESNNLDYMTRLIEAGAFIGFDRCGMHSDVAPLDVQVANLAELCRRGLADHIVLSHDDAVYFDMVPPETLAKIKLDYPYGHLEKAMLGQLREAGVTDDQIHTMFVENPRRYFGRTKTGDSVAGTPHGVPRPVDA
jgi:phosphotriesterase-related protein